METNELFYRVIHSEGKLNNTPLSKISKEIGTTIRNTHYVLKGLEKMGLITKINNANKKANDYIPNFEAIERIIRDDEKN